MAEIESHLTKCVLPIWVSVTAFASLALFNYNGYPEICGLRCHLRSPAEKSIIMCLCLPSRVGLGGEKVRGQVPRSRLAAVD